MMANKVLEEPIFPYEFTIPQNAVDENGHGGNTNIACRLFGFHTKGRFEGH